jgi:membrane protease subunit (stomatin/prohibitin family)
MGIFSRSSGKTSYRDGHQGSNQYQRKGILGNLMNAFGSGSPRDNYPGQYPNQPNSSAPLQTTACLKCNGSVPAGSKFCPHCGEKASEGLFCVSCGEKQLANAKFCAKCGAKTNG